MNNFLPLGTEMGQIQSSMGLQKMGKPDFGLEEDTTNRQAERPVLDTELFIRKTFDQDADAGISLLFRQYYPMLCSHAVRYVYSKTIAEGIVAEIFYEFHTQHRYQTITTSYQTYLFTAVRAQAFDYVQAKMQEIMSLDQADFTPIHSTQNPDSITQYEELYHDVESAINAMPLKRRQIYVMHRFEGKNDQEIANELNLSRQTIEAQLYQAIHQIRNTLKGRWLLVFYLTIQLWH